VRFDDMGQRRARQRLSVGIFVSFGIVAIPLMLVADVMTLLDHHVGAALLLLLLITCDVAVLVWAWQRTN
jgi:hypothetical protein